ncbi:MAG: ATP-dependent Clp protease ATP-binding subunit, partial [Streptococcaceae bacterium]|nr:ATP-dependent Clp protease ATP-binding subunit [Streptococcaceae bacterium]
MLCQNCGVNVASIHLYTVINGQKRQLDYCQNCYQKLKNQNQGNDNPFSTLRNQGGGQMPFDNLDDFLRKMADGRQQMNQRSEQPQNPQAQAARGGRGNKGGVLDEFGIDITAQAKNGKIDPVVGRDEEIGRLIEILNRRTKNNPVLIGEPGVGKTAVVEGF